MLGKKIGLDLGTTVTRLHVRGDGTILTQPSAAALDAEGTVRGIGTAAQQLSNRPGITVHTPLRDGAIADGVAADALLAGLIGRVSGRQRIFRPDVMVGVPPGLDGTGRRFLLDVCARAGARTMYLIDSPLAAALGAGIAVSTNPGRLLVDVGAGTVDAAIIAAEGTVVWRSSTRGAARLTAEVAGYVGGSLGVEVGMAGAEELKREIGSAVLLAEERTLRVAARREGEDTEVVVSSHAVHRAMREWVESVTTLIEEVLAESPPRLAQDVRERTGLTLCGGGAQLRGLERHLATALRIPASVAADPTGCVVRGAGVALENLDVVRRTFLYVR